MNKSEKNQEIDALVAKIDSTPNFYLTDISTLKCGGYLQAESHLCFKQLCWPAGCKEFTLLRKALERASR
jgi:hypothetical protein